MIYSIRFTPACGVFVLCVVCLVACEYSIDLAVVGDGDVEEQNALSPGVYFIQYFICEEDKKKHIRNHIPNMFNTLIDM